MVCHISGKKRGEKTQKRGVEGEFGERENDVTTIFNIWPCGNSIAGRTTYAIVYRASHHKINCPEL